MADIAASVLARLKNKAKESGRSYQLCLQLFCQEEFLRRLEKSKYSENLVLKGGLFIYSVTDFDSRVTVDIDFLLRKVPGTPERLKSVLEEIIATPTGNDFVTFEIKDIAPIAVAKKYAGIGASIVAHIKISQDYEWILIYAKSNQFNAFTKRENQRKYYSTPDIPGREWRVHDLTKQTTAKERPNSFFTIVNPKNGTQYPANPNRTWAITDDTFEKYLKETKSFFRVTMNF